MAPTAGVAFVALLSGLGARCARSSLRRCHSRVGRHGYLPGWVVYEHVTRQDIAFYNVRLVEVEMRGGLVLMMVA